MKLLSLKITSEFRNLKGLSFAFDQEQDTYVIIGNNGTGKTNVLEAISSIFSVLLAHKQNFIFGFVIRYSINEDVYRISYNIANHVVSYKKNSVEVTDAEMTYPSRVVFNYSGEDTRIWEQYYKNSYKEYMNSVRSLTALRPLNMVYIDRTMWHYVLLCMLNARSDNEAFDRFLSDKLQITDNSSVSVFINIDIKRLQTWKSINQITHYLNQLHETLRLENGIGSGNVSAFNPNNDDARLLFSKLIGAHQVIEKFSIIYNGVVEAGLLSEGEKKMMVVLFILESLADEQTLVLMDEPDSHIHISRKAELNEMFRRMTNRSNLITSHSPTLTATFDKESIIMLDRKEDGYSTIIDPSIVNLVEKLTNGMWSSQRQNIFLASHDDILIVEGPSDVVFITAALNYFHKNGCYTNLKFEFIPSGGAAQVKAFAQKFTPKSGQMVFAFFDGDEAGVKGMNQVVPCSLEKGQKWTVQNFGKARKENKTWFSFYPPYRKKFDNFNVEDYFTCRLFRKYILSFNSLDTIKGKEGLKSKLSKDCEDGLIDEKYYKKFDVLFQRIEAIKVAEQSGLTVI